MNTGNWQIIDEKTLEPGLHDSPKAITESKDIPGEIRMFRGTTNIAAGIIPIAKAISEPKARLKWVERISENILIEGKPDDGQWLSYEAYNLIWPISNRDYVFRQTLEHSLHEEKKRIVLKVSSIKHPDYPKNPSRVRGLLPICTFRLDEISEKQTKVKVMVQVDPGGSIPNFVKNIIQKGWALKTMRALNMYVKKTG